MSLKQLIVALIAVSSASAFGSETYTIDSNHTFPSFEADHMGLSILRGKFTKTSGTIVLDRTAKSGAVDIVIDANTIDFGHEKLNRHARTEPLMFDTAKFPTVTYRSKSITFKNDVPISVDGEMTLHGITRPLTLTINKFKCILHPMLKKEICGADASAQFKRSDFGITYGLPGFSPEVKLAIQIEAIGNANSSEVLSRLESKTQENDRSTQEQRARERMRRVAEEEAEEEAEEKAARLQSSSTLAAMAGALNVMQGQIQTAQRRGQLLPSNSSGTPTPSSGHATGSVNEKPSGQAYVAPMTRCVRVEYIPHSPNGQVDRWVFHNDCAVKVTISWCESEGCMNGSSGTNIAPGAKDFTYILQKNVRRPGNLIACAADSAYVHDRGSNWFCSPRK